MFFSCLLLKYCMVSLYRLLRLLMYLIRFISDCLIIIIIVINNIVLLLLLLLCFKFRELGKSTIEGFADDYAFMISGLLDLFEACQDVSWLEWACQLQEKMVELFWDHSKGGFFSTTTADPSILLRMKDGRISQCTSVTQTFHHNHTLDSEQFMYDPHFMPRSTQGRIQDFEREGLIVLNLVGKH